MFLWHAQGSDASLGAIVTSERPVSRPATNALAESSPPETQTTQPDEHQPEAFGPKVLQPSQDQQPQPAKFKGPGLRRRAGKMAAQRGVEGLPGVPSARADVSANESELHSGPSVAPKRGAAGTVRGKL